MQYLMIQNPGEAPVEGHITLGVSTSRDCGEMGIIGFFGTGTKQATNLCLRKGIPPVIFCGRSRLDFSTKPMKVNDGLLEKTFGKVICRVTGRVDGKQKNRTIDLGFVVEHGAEDWTDLGMALREYISNAIDRTKREEGDFIPALRSGRLCVKVVDDKQVRAKAGTTRVFVAYTDDVIKYHSELGKRFLHFSEPESLKKTLLPKRARNLSDRKVAMIYRHGVFVREIEYSDEPSVFDYNFGNDLRMDEARNVDDYRCKGSAAKALRKATADELCKIFLTLIDRKEHWEHSFDRYDLSIDCLNGEDRKKAQENWKKGWELAAGNAIMCQNIPYFMEVVRKKGYSPVAIPADAIAWFNACRENGIKTSSVVLTDNEQRGRETLPATVYARNAVDMVWGWFQEVGLTNKKDPPIVACFREIMSAGERCLGFRVPGTNEIRLNIDICDGGISKDLLKTTLEEINHYITDSGDFCRDFQEVLLEMIVTKFRK